jgi:hypothetical protein
MLHPRRATALLGSYAYIMFVLAIYHILGPFSNSNFTQDCVRRIPRSELKPHRGYRNASDC